MASSPTASSHNLSSPTSTRTSMTSSQATSSAVFVLNALDKIANTKEGRKNKNLKEVVQNAQSKYTIYPLSSFVFFPTPFINNKRQKN